MANMFSHHYEKKIPKTLNECYQSDPTVDNLRLWCNRLEKMGIILFVVLVVIGFIDTVVSGIDAKKLLDEIGKESIEELRKTGTEIPTVADVIWNKVFTWALYAIIEYASHHVIALIVSSLASIVHNTKITANVALYNASIPSAITKSDNAELSTNSFKKNDESKEMSDISEITGTKTKCIICENCGLENAEYQRFCAHCGESLRSRKPPIVNSNPKYTNKKPSKSTKCACGNRYYGNICPNCGRKSEE